MLAFLCRWSHVWIIALLVSACPSNDSSRSDGDTADRGATDGTGGKGAVDGSTAGSGSSKASDPAEVGKAGLRMPCDVGTVVAKRCQSCHGKALIGGAPMPLLTRADFLADAVVTKGKKVFEVAKQRIRDAAKPMPPGAQLVVDELATLDGWLMAGAPERSANETCTPDERNRSADRR